MTELAELEESQHRAELTACAVFGGGGHVPPLVRDVRCAAGFPSQCSASVKAHLRLSVCSGGCTIHVSDFVTVVTFIFSDVCCGKKKRTAFGKG